MATLGELPEKERKELVRALAREIWLGVEHQGELPISLKEGVAMVVEKSGLLHESNFYGDGFNAAQVAKLEEFREHRNHGFDIAEVYDKCIVDVEEMAPGFARKSDDLRRMWGMLHIMRELCKADSPFATLRTADAVEDRDRSDESNDENEDDEESDEGEEEQDSDSAAAAAATATATARPTKCSTRPTRRTPRTVATATATATETATATAGSSRPSARSWTALLRSPVARNPQARHARATTTPTWATRSRYAHPTRGAHRTTAVRVPMRVPAHTPKRATAQRSCHGFC